MMPDLGGGYHPDSQHTEIDEESEHTPQVPNSPEPSPLGDRGWLMKSSNDLQSSPPGELIKRFLSSPKDGEAEQLPPESLEAALADANELAEEEEILAEEPELPPEISEPTEPTESTEPTGTSQVFKSSEAKRMKSREWHKKFVPKGVARNPKMGSYFLRMNGFVSGSKILRCLPQTNVVLWQSKLGWKAVSVLI